MKRAYMESQIRTLVNALELEDADGKKHAGALEVKDFDTPKTFFPRVFVSYSTRYAVEKLRYLENALMTNGFEPIRGTDYGRASQPVHLGAHEVTADVPQMAFPAIEICVAFISLQVPREDFRVGDSEPPRFVLAPWTVAEEVYAWTLKTGLIVRLKDASVEDPQYNRHILTKVFRDADEYPSAVQEVIDELLRFRDGPQFTDLRRAADEKLLQIGPNAHSQIVQRSGRNRCVPGVARNFMVSHPRQSWIWHY
jgi:hypothetical protein